MKTILTLAIACSIAVYIAEAQDNAALRLFSIKSGETLPIHFSTYITPSCEPLFVSFEGIDVLEGPPELSLKFEPGMVHANTTSRDCPNPVPGGTIMLTAAKDLSDQEEAVLTFRVRLKTKQGVVQQTFRYGVLLFPSGEQHDDADAVRARAEELATRASERFDELQRDCNPIRVHLEERAGRISSPEAQALSLRAWRAAIAYHWCRQKALASLGQVNHDRRAAADGKAQETPADNLHPVPMVSDDKEHIKTLRERIRRFQERLRVIRATMTASIQAVAPISAGPSALQATVEEGYRIEEGFFNVKIGEAPFLLQGLIVKRADAVGKLPIMLYTHGSTPSMEKRQEMTPRGVKDGTLRLVRDYARRGWLGVVVLRRAYGQSDGPDPTVLKCESSTPSLQDGMDAAADDLEATLNYVGRREDADSNRMMALGVSGGGAAVVALSARNIPGLKVVVNVSGGLALLNCDKYFDRLVEAMRYYGTRSRVPNLWYYAMTDTLFPEQMVVRMRAAFLEGGAYAKLVHYPKLIIAPDTDGHQLWSKQASMVMLDVDGYLRNRGLPTWDFSEVKALVNKNGIKEASRNFIELYVAAPGYKALAQSTKSETSLVDTYGADTLEHAKERAVSVCQQRYPGHTCKIIDPPESRGEK